MALEEVLSELLHHYDCVVIPHLGGFVTNYKPAQIDANGRAFPPRKDLSFNRNLTGSDGLLEKALSERNGISFEEASASVKAKVDAYWSQLNNGLKLDFNKIGVLYVDNNKSLQFEPEAEHNYLTAAYGFEPFELPEKIEKLTSKEAPVIDFHADKKERVEEPLELETPRESRSIYWVAAAALVPFIAFSMYTGLKTNFKSPTELSVADLNPLSSKISTSPKYEVRSEDELIAEVTVENEAFPEDKELFRYSFVENDSTTVWVDLRDIAAKNKELAQGPYHIIAGCFGEETNAVRFVDRLQKRGYSAGILDYHKSLHRVKISSYNTYKDALNELHLVRSNGQFPNAWMLKKN